MPDLQDEINKENTTNAIDEVRLKFICKASSASHCQLADGPPLIGR
jgi:hypothetical protein